MRRSTSNRTAGRLFDNPSIRGLSLGALDPYVRRQVRGTRPTILFFSAAGRTVPDFLSRWVNGKGLTIVPVPDPADVEQRVLRSLPQLVVIDADGGPQGLVLCARLKADSYSAIVPLAVLTSRHTTDRVQEWFTAGADEVISPLFEPTEQASRLDGLMTRTARDVAVNPSTRLPGTTEIEREIRRRMENGELFAVCYADLDHFKEYNDRYSYNDGDRVIYILSRILHDVVKGLLGNRGFIGHIGGDDFIFIIPFDAIPDVCGEVLEVFETVDRVDPAKVPAGGVRARCAVCSNVFPVNASVAAATAAVSAGSGPAVAPRPPAPPRAPPAPPAPPTPAPAPPRTPAMPRFSGPIAAPPPPPAAPAPPAAAPRAAPPPAPRAAPPPAAPAMRPAAPPAAPAPRGAPPAAPRPPAAPAAPAAPAPPPAAAPA